MVGEHWVVALGLRSAGRYMVGYRVISACMVGFCCIMELFAEHDKKMNIP